MLKLNLEGIKDRQAWDKAGVTLPSFDVEQMRKDTIEAPEWVHFGAGNIFRGYIASLMQNLLNEGLATKGIVAVAPFDNDLIEKVYEPFDNLVLSVGLKADGGTVLSVNASIAEAISGYTERLVQIATSPSLKMISFTITEKGYSLVGLNGEYLPNVAADIVNGPAKPTHAMSMVTALLWHRFNAGGAPIALSSMDNCSHNGEKLGNAVREIAGLWLKEGYVTQDFISYINDESKVAFPFSMIDKITPRPARSIGEMLKGKGIEDMDLYLTKKQTYIAPFVNAEMPQYLVIEDRFPGGRPCLEKAGVYFTDRETVNKSETMKVATCLNPLHTSMAVFGCLLGYDHIAKEMADGDIAALVKCVGYKEGLKVVTNPGIINPQEFLDEVVGERLPNMFIPDMPQRIATDTSMKIPMRFGGTIRAYSAGDEYSVDDLIGIPLVIAAWLRYLLGTDDLGNPMELSPDPLLDDLRKALEGVRYDDPSSYKGQARVILSDEGIFTADLCQIGLAGRIEDLFVRMLEGPGSVRKVLHDTMSQNSL